MDQLNEMITRCERVLANPSDKKALTCLVNDYVAAYEVNIAKYTGFLIGLRKRDPESVDDSTISMMKASLRAYKEHLDHESELARASSSNVTAQATSTAVASVSVGQVVDLIERDGELTDDEKAALRSLLFEAKEEARKKSSGAFARIGAKIMEGVENATPGVVSGAIGYLASLAAAHFGM
ncbi:MAG: hypothetical protein U0M51_01950 [Eggerthellaceae bacterium]